MKNGYVLFRRSISVLGIAVALLLLPARGTKAQMPTLEGETLQNSTLPAEKVNCDLVTGQLGFGVRGTAAGPYPGEFFETGTIFFDPATGRITGGEIEFTIYTPTQKTVTGTKTPKDGLVQCTSDPKANIFTFSVTVPNLSYSANLLAELSSDEGRATLDFSGSRETSGKETVIRVQFTEIFHSSNFVQTPGKVTGGGTIVQEGSKNGLTFGFNAQNNNDQMKGSGTIIDHNAGVRVKILDVATFGVVGSHATFTGRAEVNGVQESYRIEVDDISEPGSGFDSFKIVTDSYAGGGTITGGNIQIHK